MHLTLSLGAQEPTIAELYHTRSASGFVGDSPQIFRNYVEARLSDASVVSLFAYRPGALDLSSTNLIGLTVAQAVTLAVSRGTIDATSAGQICE